MQKVSVFDFVSIFALWFGGLNWGLVGLFQYDLVEKIFGSTQTTGARLVYAYIGIATLYLAVSAYLRESKPQDVRDRRQQNLPTL